MFLPQQLMVPRVSNIRLFEFPRNSAYHYLDFEGVSKGPDQTSYLFRDIVKPISLLHVTELTSFEGNPRTNPVQLLPEIRSFHAKNKRFRVNLSGEMIKDDTILTIVNYSFIHEKYKYTRSIFAEYYKWLNIQKTLWSEVNKLTVDNEKQHFIFMGIPKKLPSVTSLNLFSEKFNQTLLRTFTTNESLFMLEFWKWLNPLTKQYSVLNSLEDKNLTKVNIIFTDDANWTCVNLGTLLSWLDNPDDKNQKIKISPEQMQKRFLRMMLSMTQLRDAADPEEKQEGEDEVSIIKDDVNKITQDPDLDEATVSTVADKYLKELEEDLKTIEDIEGNSLVEDIDSEAHAGTIVDLNKNLSSDDLIKGIADNLAEDGVISAGEYKRVNTLLEKSKTIKSPYGTDKTLFEDSVVLPEDVVITEDTQIPDISNVTDKSMLKSTLIDFDSRYITKVLPKDNLSMVVNIQKAGMIITDYDIEQVKDVLGDFEFHTVKLKPVQGMPSTIRFKIPTIHEDGYFTSNNLKYKMRKQRVDVPIRKVNASMVSLTSYYGKVFVQRSQKKVNNYQDWLTNQIMSKGLNPTDESIKDLKTGDVFLNDFICPRVFSILAQTFRSFKVGPYQFVFDRKELQEKYSKEDFKLHENKKLKSVICGYSNKGILTIDKNDTIYETTDAGMIVLGSIEDIIKIDIFNAPVDFSEVKIHGKYIPVGFVLAFEIGLTNLIKLLGVTPKRVPTGTRIQYDSNEWSIVFADETLIFNRDDKIATMVLAGFNEYHRAIRSYPTHVFDKPNVYLNVLEEHAVTARYLREIRLLDKLFIDPITKELLIEMKEPTTFKALLVRSSELLLTDHHPHMMDIRYMRIRGYERVSGAIYAELVNSIRQFESSGSKTTSRVEMNPYSIWKRLTEDSSKAVLDEINPIENLKQIEAVTFAGTGGRMKRAMTKPARMYLDSDMGVISEATKDSSDVAINTYLTANPQFKSLRGTVKPLDLKEKGVTALVSTSALAAVGSDKDDQLVLLLSNE